MNELSHMNNWKRPKAAVYVRVSTVNQAEKGHGLEAQLSVCKKMCEIKNYDVVHIFSDEGISGTLKPEDRQGFNKLLESGKNKNFEIIVFYAFDRLARDIRVFLNIVDKLREFNIKIVSCKENIDTTTDAGEFMMNIYASVSHLELKTIKSRLAMGREQKKLKSGYIGGSLPYGYSMVDKEIVIDPQKATIVQFIFHSYHVKKLSMRKIGLGLDKGNIDTPKTGKKWHKSSISTILNNKKKYEGCIINENENDICWPKILVTNE